MQITKTLKELQKTLKHKTAIKDLILLTQYPNQEFPYFYLEAIRPETSNPKQISLDDIHLDIIINATKYFINNPIYLCDEITVDQINKRLQSLLNMIDIEKQLGNNQTLFDLEKERKALIKYLSKAISSNGKIRAFNNAFEKPKRAFIKNLKHTLIELENITPP